MTALATIFATAISTSGLFAAVLWLAKDIIQTRLKASVEHEFGVKLERVRRESKEIEERLKHSLELKKEAISALRADVLSGASDRQSGVHSRRLSAIDALWGVVADSLYPTAHLVQILSIYKFPETLKLTAENEQLRAYFAKLNDQYDNKSHARQAALKERPYISDTAWALFCAYSAIMGHARLQLILLASGLNQANVIDSHAIETMIVAALPDHEAYLREHGIAVHPYLVEVLEQRLLDETRRILTGKDETTEQLAQAAQMLSAAHLLYNDDAEKLVPTVSD